MKNLIYSLIFIAIILQGCSDRNRVTSSKGKTETTSSESIQAVPSDIYSTMTSLDVVTTYSPTLNAKHIKAWDIMIGSWYGKQLTKQGGYREWIVTRFSDGTFKIKFRTSDESGVIEEEIQQGLWGVADPIYFSITLEASVNGEPSEMGRYVRSYRNVYEIISLTEEKFVYKSFKTDTEFTVKRVGTDFEFPEISHK